MIIRQATIDDAKAIAALLVQLGHPLEEPEVVDKIRFFAQDDYHLLICEVDGKTEGFLALHWFDKFHSIGRTGRITALCVSETARNGGIGGTLVAAAEKLLKENHCREIEVTSNMRRALSPGFYGKHGYEQKSWHFVKNLTTSSRV